MLRFWKLNALGNHFVFMLHDAGIDYVALARRVCRPETQVGGDGLLTIDPTVEPPMVRMWNPDGTTDFCGNGMCCAAHLLHHLDYPSDILDTPIRRVAATVEPIDRIGSRVTIVMERGTFDPVAIPLAIDYAAPAEGGYNIRVDREIVRVHCVNNGNMHTIVMTDALPNDETFRRLGPMIENHPMFPHRTNVLWCDLKSAILDMRIWERGVGETLSCGTGAAAAFSVYERLGLLTADALSINTTGGRCEVKAVANGLTLTTCANLSFMGTLLSIAG